MRNYRVVMLVLAMLLATVGVGRADFILTGSNVLNLQTPDFGTGIQHDTSELTVLRGGYVNTVHAYGLSQTTVNGVVPGDPSGNPGAISYLHAHGSSTVDVTSHVVSYLWGYDFSVINVNGGYVGNLYANNSSAVDMLSGSASFIYLSDHGSMEFMGGFATAVDVKDNGLIDFTHGGINVMQTFGSGQAFLRGDGFVSYLDTFESSDVEVSDGELAYLRAFDSSHVTFTGKNFVLGAGLTMSGSEILGTGVLSGQWNDGTPWAVTIQSNSDTAIIDVVEMPEPATMLLLGLGGVALLRRKRAA